MAVNKFEYDGYGQLELNNVAFRRDGRIEAQCALDTSFTESAPAENGMLLAIDKVNGIVKKPVANETLPLALHYSSEHMYDERHPGLKNFSLGPDTFYPRMGYPAVGDLFTTNCLCYETATYANQAAVESALEGAATTAVYATYDTSGRIKLVSAAPTHFPVMKVVKNYTMPDGQKAVKLQVIG